MLTQPYRLNPPRARFRPPLWGSLLAATLVAAFIGLGFWQLHRAEEKRLFFAAFESAEAANARDTAVADSEAAKLRFQWVRLRGHFDGGHQILLDAQVLHGRSGYEVLTPLLSADSAVLVNRGWIAAPADRSELPEVVVDDEEREITARINLLPAAGLRSAPSTAEPSGPWPRRLLFPTATEIAQLLGYPVHDYQLLLGQKEPDGYVREWRPNVMEPERHLAYAVQWFAMAVALLLLYIIVNMKRGPPSDR